MTDTKTRRNNNETEETTTTKTVMIKDDEVAIAYKKGAELGRDALQAK